MKEDWMNVKMDSVRVLSDRERLGGVDNFARY